MSYLFQTYRVNSIATQVELNQTEVNIRDHEHGADGSVQIGLLDLGSIVLEGSTAVGTNSNAIITIQTASACARFYEYSVLASLCCIGLDITATETIQSASAHSWIDRSATAYDRLGLVNGYSNTTQTISYKVYEVRESP